MNNVTGLIFPLADFLYIFQLLEYDRRSFLRWVGPRWYKRNLQSVGTIVWTQKAIALYFVALLLFLGFLLIAISVPFSLVNGSVVIFIGLAVLDLLLIPGWIVLASLLVEPLETYKKQAIIHQAMQKRAQLATLTVIAVAGSVGKSSTRSYITSLLQTQFKTHTPERNFNTLLGLSQDMLKALPDDTEYYVVELGEFRRGDLRILADLVKPTYLVLTTVGSQHIEQLGSREYINQEFMSLVNYPGIQKVYLNATNRLAANLATFDKRQVADPDKTKADLTNIPLQLPDAPSTYENLALALAISHDLGITAENSRKTVATLKSFERRLNVSVQNGVTIIDDSYNISPESARNALALLRTYTGRKIVVTGGIVDQGDMADEVNQAFGEQLAATASIIIVANNRFHTPVTKGIKTANTTAEIISSPHPQKTPELLAARVKSGDVVLVQNELPEEYWH